MSTTMLLALIFSLYSHSVSADMKSLIRFKDNIIRTSHAYRVNPDWVMAIIMQESGGNPNLYRIEPKYHYFLQPQSFAVLNHISLLTEITSQRTSWGLGSIMGGLAREMGYTGLLTGLLNPDLNIMYMCMYLNKLGEISTAQDDVFSMYNGGPGIIKHRLSKTPMVYRKVPPYKPGAYPRGYLNQPYIDGVNAELFKVISYKPTKP